MLYAILQCSKPYIWIYVGKVDLNLKYVNYVDYYACLQCSPYHTFICVLLTFSGMHSDIYSMFIIIHKL